MSLHFDLCVNNLPIGLFIASRRYDAVPTLQLPVRAEKRRAVARRDYGFRLVAAGLEDTNVSGMC